MAYDARHQEVREELDTQDLEPARKAALAAVIDRYFDQREGWLENLLELLEPGDDAIHSKWIDKAKRAAAAAHDALGKEKSLWLARVANEEYAFFYALMKSQVPVKRDLMVAQTRALKKAEKEFERKWQAIRDADKKIEERMKTVALEYEKILQDAAEFAAEAEMEAREALRARLKIAFSVLDLGVVETVLKNAIRFIELQRNEAAERRLEIHALLSREEGVFATFKEARAMVEEFLEETSYPRVKDAYDDAEDAAEALAGKVATRGQKDDARALEGAIKRELKAVFARAEDAYKAFARKHEHLFFGPLGGGYYQELMEGDFWKERSSRWTRSKHDIDDLLRERTLACSDSQVLEVSMSELSADDRKQVRAALEGHCRDLLRAWNAFKEFSNEPEWVLESRETLTSILDALR